MTDIRAIDRDELLECLREEYDMRLRRAQGLASEHAEPPQAEAHLEAVMQLREADALDSALQEIAARTKHAPNAKPEPFEGMQPRITNILKRLYGEGPGMDHHLAAHDIIKAIKEDA